MRLGVSYVRVGIGFSQAGLQSLRFQVAAKVLRLYVEKVAVTKAIDPFVGNDAEHIGKHI